MHNGKVPWLQLVVGIIVGIISSMSYVKYKKPEYILNALGVSTGERNCALPGKKNSEAPIRLTQKVPSRPKKQAHPVADDGDDEDYPDILGGDVMSGRVFPVPIFAVSEELSLPNNIRHINEVDETEELSEVEDDDAADFDGKPSL
jgi:hypothetical protein